MLEPLLCGVFKDTPAFKNFEDVKKVGMNRLNLMWNRKIEICERIVFGLKGSFRLIWQHKKSRGPAAEK